MYVTALIIWLVCILLLVLLVSFTVRIVRHGWESVQIFGKDAPDAGDDWLAKQIREEQRARAFLEREGLKVRQEHFENCDAGKLRQEHFENCDAKKARSDVQGKLSRKQMDMRKAQIRARMKK